MSIYMEHIHVCRMAIGGIESEALIIIYYISQQTNRKKRNTKKLRIVQLGHHKETIRNPLISSTLRRIASRSQEGLHPRPHG